MTITITARDSDGDGTGVNFATFFSTFYQEFSGLPTQSSGGFQYALHQENGSSILFNGTEAWNVDPNGTETTGNFNEIVFGDDFQQIEGQAGTNSADLTIKFPEVIDASTRLQSGLGVGSTDKLMDYLKADSLRFVGSDGDDAFKGFAKADVLLGNDGNDRLDGNRGNDKLTGGDGIDTFVFAKGDDQDTITDFQASGKGHDIVDLSGLKGVDTFKEARALFEDHHKDVWIDAGHGDVLVIKGVEIDDLGKGDFVF
jgi:Ca2+-binding RTX toxin-like protein